jgi:hypothetical protein
MKHLPQDDLTHLGGHILDARYFEDVAEAIAEAGMTVVRE